MQDLIHAHLGVSNEGYLCNTRKLLFLKYKCKHQICGIGDLGLGYAYNYQVTGGEI